MKKTPMREAMKLYMAVNNVTARGLERALGIDHTAVSRFVAGKDISLKNFSILLSWFVTESNNPGDDNER